MHLKHLSLYAFRSVILFLYNNFLFHGLDNATRETLSFAQLLLSVRHMSVYQTEDGKLWTNECRLGYTGSIFPASLAFGHTAPEQAHGSKLISEPREAPTSGLTAKAIAGAIFRQQP